MDDMRYTVALRKLFEVMEGRTDIDEVKFNRKNDSFDVISSGGVHVCFGDEFRNAHNIGYKKIKWSGDDPHGMMTSYTKIFGYKQIGFRIMYCADDFLRLVDNTSDDMKMYVIHSVEEGKEKAQAIFEQYCDEIMKNICS